MKYIFKKVKKDKEKDFTKHKSNRPKEDYRRSKKHDPKDYEVSNFDE